MAKGMFEVPCPCCKAVLKIDPETQAVIAHTVPEKPPLIEDLAAEVVKLKGEGARREELFQKHFEAEKSHGKVQVACGEDAFQAQRFLQLLGDVNQYRFLAFKKCGVLLHAICFQCSHK